MNWTLFLQLIAALETGGHPDPDNAIGDGGKALGRYQIHECFVDDVNTLHDVKYSYSDRSKRNVVDAIVIEWHEMYCHVYHDLGDYVSMARRHNGGPRGHLKRSTLEYGRRAQAWMDEHEKEFK